VKGEEGRGSGMTDKYKGRESNKGKEGKEIKIGKR
jgi:hypothetical protein